MGTTMMTINTAIPIPMMIRIFMSFHLGSVLLNPVRPVGPAKEGKGDLGWQCAQRIDDSPHLLADAVGASTETLSGDGEGV